MLFKLCRTTLVYLMKLLELTTTLIKILETIKITSPFYATAEILLKPSYKSKTVRILHHEWRILKEENHLGSRLHWTIILTVLFGHRPWRMKKKTSKERIHKYLSLGTRIFSKFNRLTDTFKRKVILSLLTRTDSYKNVQIL